MMPVVALVADRAGGQGGKRVPPAAETPLAKMSGLRFPRGKPSVSLNVAAELPHLRPAALWGETAGRLSPHLQNRHWRPIAAVSGRREGRP